MIDMTGLGFLLGLCICVFIASMIGLIAGIILVLLGLYKMAAFTLLGSVIIGTVCGVYAGNKLEQD